MPSCHYHFLTLIVDEPKSTAPLNQVHGADHQVCVFKRPEVSARLQRTQPLVEVIAKKSHCKQSSLHNLGLNLAFGLINSSTPLLKAESDEGAHASS